MNCQSCNLVIDPKWKNALIKNECPFCGQQIMEEFLKNLFIDLNDILLKFENHKDQLNDWLKNNFGYLQGEDLKVEVDNQIKLQLDLLKNKIKEEVVLESNKEIELKKENVKVESASVSNKSITESKVPLNNSTNVSTFFKRAGVVSDDAKFQNFKENYEQKKNSSNTKETSGGLLLGDDLRAAMELDDDGVGDIEEDSGSDFANVGPLVNYDQLMKNSNTTTTSEQKDLMKLQNSLKKQSAAKNNLHSGGGAFKRV